MIHAMKKTIQEKGIEKGTIGVTLEMMAVSKSQVTHL